MRAAAEHRPDWNHIERSHVLTPGAPTGHLQNLFHLSPARRSYRYINVIWFFSHWLAMSNSCVNPFIYAIYTVSRPFACLSSPTQRF